MKVALLGATGFVGSALLKEALDRGHVVTAIVPDPEKLEEREGLTAKAGDVYDTASLATLIQGNEAIISAFNPGWKNPNLYDDQVRGTASIIAAIKKAGIKRVLWVGGAGGLEVTPGVRLVDSPDMPHWVRPGALATINALDQLREEPELEWSYLSPSAELTAEQDFCSGLRRRDDRRTGTPDPCPAALYSRVLKASSSSKTIPVTGERTA